MVLKKSKTRLNSGATQRASSHAGFYRVDYFGPLQQETQNGLQVCLTSVKEDAMTTSYLKEIEDYLNCSFPVDPRPTRFYGDPCCYSLRKKKRWLLEENIKTMIEDSDFLENSIPQICVRHRKIREQIGFSRHRLFQDRVLSANNPQENDTKKQQVHKSRKRYTYHGRGVQRPHLFNAKAQHDDDNSPTIEKPEPVSELTFSVRGSFHIDARSMVLNGYTKRKSNYWGYFPQKAFMKTKGAVNGLLSYRKGYTKAGMKEDELQYLYDLSGDMYEDDVSDDESEHHANLRPRSDTATYNITDFLVQAKPKRKKHRKKESVFHQDETLHGSVSDNEIKYPKGSYVYVSHSEFVQDQSDRDWEIVRPEDIHPDDEGDVNRRPHEEFQTLVDTEFLPKEHTILTESNFDDFDNSFSEVNICMSKDEAAFFSSPHRSVENKNTFGWYNMVIGRSLPLCFVIDVSKDITGQLAENRRYLVARKSGVDELSWSVSLQDHCRSQIESNRQLQQIIAKKYPKAISLLELADLARHLHSWSDADGNIIAENRDTGTTSVERSTTEHSDSLWHKMPNLVPQSTAILTANEACETIQSASASGKQDPIIECSISEDKAWGHYTEDLHESTECNVCFSSFTTDELQASTVLLLPCFHRFCRQCWRDHINSCIRNGINNLTCMHTTCSNTADETTVMTLIPSELALKWRLQVRNRCIDSNSFCAWCPNKTCQMVAVSSSEPLRQVYGKPVICDCKQCWCSSCQMSPHWPASCDQVAMYRKLRAKAKIKLDYLPNQMDFYVDVKKCPNCSYPIEKHEGCDSVICRMCTFNFCWECLKSFHNHSFSQCRRGLSKEVTFNLQNKLDISLPLKYFFEMVESGKVADKQRKIKSLFEKMKRNLAATAAAPSQVRWMQHRGVDLKLAAGFAIECASFVEQTYTLLEYFYLLLCFVHPKKSKSQSEKRQEKHVIREIAQLKFIAWRLEESILERSLPYIFKSMKQSSWFMNRGYDLISKLIALAPSLQSTAKDVEIESLDKLDPQTFLRYK